MYIACGNFYYYYCPFEHHILKECITYNNMVIKGTNYIFLEFEELNVFSSNKNYFIIYHNLAEIGIDRSTVSKNVQL